MKNLVYLLFAFLITTELKAQFITTNPSSTPVTVGSDLNLAAGKIIQFNNIPVIKSFGTGNLAFGPYSGNLSNVGTYNVSVGQSASQYSTAGTNNTYLGFASGLQSNGSDNVGVGSSTLTAANSGSQNTAIGTGAGGNNAGNFNVYIGNYAGENTTGSGNLFAGGQAGRNNLAGSNNVFLGNSAGSPNTGILRAVAIGNNAKVDINDAIVLGDATNAASIKVGIGVSSPTETFHVKGGGVRFENLPTDAPGGTAVQYVVIDATGKLYKYTGTAPARIGVSESVVGQPNSFADNWVLKNDFLYNKNKRGIIIGEGISSLPKGYGMYVTDGILTEKVKVAIKNTSDWADYVFSKNYKRMSLNEVEKYINLNKHLPNMPSATEMVSEGNDLVKTDAKLLEKIEELTLYMIELKKENSKMKSQINALKRKLNN